MSRLTWLSPTVESLTTISQGEYWPTTLSVEGNIGAVRYSVIAGDLPPGLAINEAAGRIYGVPVVTNLYKDINDLTPDSLANVSVDVSRLYKFTIRAKDTITNSVADRSFGLTITNIEPPVIAPRAASSQHEVFLGSYLDGVRFVLPGFQGQTDQILKFTAFEVNPGATLRWKVVAGNLPNGLDLTSDGYLLGYLKPNPSINDTKGGGWDGSRWNIFPWDFVGVRVVRSFNFTLQVYDGENYDEVRYKFTVLPRRSATADTDLITADNSLIPTDSIGLHVPILLNTEFNIPDSRQLSYFAYKFDSVDLDGDTVEYLLHTPGYGGFDENDGISEGGFDYSPFDLGANYTPSSLSINASTGWIYGFLEAQTEERKEFIFQVSVRKLDLPEYESPRKTFKLTILGNLNDLIEWNTGANLGLIDNGSISEFKLDTIIHQPIFANVAGTTPNVDVVSYTLSSGTLPSGMEFTSNGLINGRTSFSYFKFDDGSTTIDGGMTFDARHTFTANVTGFNTASGNIVTSSEKTFTITVNNVNPTSYEDIFLRALPTRDQRTLFNNILSNTNIFSTNLIYRASDPHFGINKSITSLFLPGLTSREITTYALATRTNHYSKSILFGDIKTAIAVDSNFKPRYEVVYIELLDDLVNTSNISPPITQHLNNTTNGHIVNGSTKTTAHVNSFNNMRQLVASRIGFAKKGALPDWMTSKQPNGKILGFTRCVVLCYLEPSTNKKNSETVAVRLRNHLADNSLAFNQIEFVADRYVLDTNLESYPDRDDKYFKFPTVGVFE